MGLLLLEENRLDRADKIQLIISYTLQGIILASAIFSFVRTRWLNAALLLGILLLTFLPAIVRRNYRVFLPVEFDLITIIFVFLAVFLGEWHSYYARFWWWDIVLHSSSGFLIGIGGLLLMYILTEEKKAHLKMKPGFIALFGFVFALAFGAFWEIFEFTMDGLLGFNMQKNGLVDTMWDLIVDALGALTIALLGYFYLRKGNLLLFDRMIHRFVDGNPKLFRRRNAK
ncbi:MAG TPA: hypothetical protein VJH68_04625 [Candidatus Nanoarchaeia archaeon]|nr:hypothetical protein [Candidatus Nanoarchaeia archaeon]